MSSLDWAPLSPGQEALLYLHYAARESDAYHLPIALRTMHPFDAGRFAAVVAELTVRHPALSSRIAWQEERAVQTICPAPMVHVPHEWLDSERSLERRLSDLTRAPFALEEGERVRAAVFSLPDGGTVVLFVFHHIAVDMWSFGLLLEELRSRMAEPALHNPRVERDESFFRFCRNQEQRWSGTARAAEADFWRGRLADIHSLGFGVDRQPGPSTAGSLGIEFDTATSARIRQHCESRGCTPLHLLFAVHARVLARRRACSTFAVGLPTHGRILPDDARSVGYYVNLVPVPCRVDPDAPFTSLIDATKSSISGVLAHAHYPYPLIVQEARNLCEKAAMVESVFAWQKLRLAAAEEIVPFAVEHPRASIQIGDATFERMPLPEREAQFPLSVLMGESATTTFFGTLKYDRRCIPDSWAHEFLDDFYAVIEEETGCQPQGTAPAAPTREPCEEKLTAFFETIARAHRDAAAVQDSERTLTFDQLFARSHAAADALRAQGIGFGHLVAVVTDGTAATAIAALGVWLSGSALLPLEARDATRQIAWLEERGRLGALIGAEGMSVKATVFDTVSDGLRLRALGAPQERLLPFEAACVFFTSGSTGAPKAVMLSQAGVVNHARAIRESLGLMRADRIAQLHGFGFDAMLEEFLPTLLAGGRVVFGPRLSTLTAPRLVEVIERFGLTVLNLPTAYWNVLSESIDQDEIRMPSSVRAVVIGGQAASTARARRWLERYGPKPRLYNTYGLTETSVSSTMFEVTDASLRAAGAVLPLGWPIAGVSVYVQNTAGALVPEGEGELLIGGSGVCLGYVDRPHLDTERLAVLNTDREVRVFRTGDIVRRDIDGRLSFLGRRDRMVKLDRERLSLDELEARFNRISGIRETHVIAESDADGRITALHCRYLTSCEAAEAEKEIRKAARKISDQVASLLRCTRVSMFPRTAGGKIDAGALIGDRRHGPSNECVDPVVSHVHAIFCAILKVTDLDPRESFFSRGGYSSLALRLLGRVERETGVRVELEEFLAAPTVETVSNRIRAAEHLLHGPFERRAVVHPDRIAIISGDRRISYGKLNSLAERTAQRLTDAGVRSGDRVAIRTHKGWEEVVAVIATLKAGAAFVPLQANLPELRARALLERSSAKAVLAQPFAQTGGWCSLPVIEVCDEGGSADPIEKPRVSAADPAYLIFTSGSSGEPKGVLISHEGATSTLREINERFGVGAHDRCLGLSSLSFDLAIYDIFGTLAAGGALVVPDASRAKDPRHWIELAVLHRITVWNSVPSSLELALSSAGAEACGLGSLRTILLSGDRISVDLARTARAKLPAARLVSLGGATEASIWSIIHEIGEIPPAQISIPYGRALARQSVDVRDAALEPVAPGGVGEICIGGSGVAIGYLDETQTRERFPRDPVTGARLFRTGDLGRVLDSGEIEILGRADRALKIRGYRVEPAEVEAALRECAGVADARVRGERDDTGVMVLTAVVLTRGGQFEGAAACRAALERRIPDYMVPNRFIVVTDVPLSPNGKLDWARIEQEAAAATEAETREDREALPLMWNRTLGAEDVSPDDNFFDRGGQSLQAVRLLRQVGARYGVELSLPAFFAEPTLRNLTAMTKGTVRLESFDVRPRTLSSLQKDVLLPDTDPLCGETVEGILEPAGIFVTGATGLVGRHLVATLLLRHAEAPIYCLVRGASDRDATERLRTSLDRLRGVHIDESRVKVVRGDLSAPRFGLAPERYTGLSRSIRAVYHSAAKISFLGGYRAHFSANVLGTREILRFVRQGPSKHLHYISSVGVLPYGAGRVVDVSTPIDGEGYLVSGYAQSKWVAERTVTLAALHGVPTSIYRLGLVASEHPGSNDIFTLVCRACLEVGSVPDIRTTFDMLPAGTIAQAIVSLGSVPGLTGVFHVVHPEPHAWDEKLSKRLCDRFNLRHESYAAWRARFSKYSESADNPMLGLLAALADAYPLEELIPPEIRSHETWARIRHECLEIPAIADLLEQYYFQPAVHVVESAPK